MAEIAFKVAVMTYFLSGQDQFFVAEITFKVPVIMASVVKSTFIETEITF